MKFTCLQENLERALSLINRTAIFKSQLPITSNVLIKATGEGIEITGTDLENTTKVTVLGKVEKEGGILLPVRTLIEIVNALPKEQVTLEVNELTAILTSGKNQAKINGTSAVEFPELNLGADKEKIAIGDVLSYIKHIAFAASTDESRAVLTSILVLFSKKEITLVATDGYRLSLKKIQTTTRDDQEEEKF